VRYQVNAAAPATGANETEAARIRSSIEKRLLFWVGKSPASATKHDWMMALCAVVRDRLVERWIETAQRMYLDDVRRVYYLSFEFLPGRALISHLLTLGLYEDFESAVNAAGLDLEELAALEPEPGLGNGGLGRLAACFLDSLATLRLPATGYGLRYEYGMFAQRIRDGYQLEEPDKWLVAGNPWKFARPEATYPIRFGGTVADAGGKRS
jgi:starch phosphorylase